MSSNDDGAPRTDQLAAALKGSPFAGRIPGILEEAHGLLLDESQKRLSESE